MKQIHLIYDGSFDGLLSTVFHIYQNKLINAVILDEKSASINLFDERLFVETNSDHSDRVFYGLKKLLKKKTLRNLFKVYLSELSESENLILNFIQKSFSIKKDLSGDYSDSDSLAISKIVKSVHRERHRMEAFIRFKRTKDGIYWANVEPDFNVLPLLGNHFKNRYADQSWVIYDLKRKFGIQYDLVKVQMLEIDFSNHFNRYQNSAQIFDEEEIAFQKLWKTYFDSSNIKSRKNTKLHIRHVPKRYWKYLVEKMEFGG